jgi:hypothetical protein
MSRYFFVGISISAWKTDAWKPVFGGVLVHNVVHRLMHRVFVDHPSGVPAALCVLGFVAHHVAGIFQLV